MGALGPFLVDDAGERITPFLCFLRIKIDRLVVVGLSCHRVSSLAVFLCRTSLGCAPRGHARWMNEAVAETKLNTVPAAVVLHRTNQFHTAKRSITIRDIIVNPSGEPGIPDFSGAGMIFPIPSVLDRWSGLLE